jgi:hypothetical protein
MKGQEPIGLASRWMISLTGLLLFLAVLPVSLFVSVALIQPDHNRRLHGWNKALTVFRLKSHGGLTSRQKDARR